MLNLATVEPVMSKPRGRPPKSDEDRLSEVLHIRLTPREADTAYRLAIKHGKPLNAVLRAILQRLARG